MHLFATYTHKGIAKWRIHVVGTYRQGCGRIRRALVRNLSRAHLKTSQLPIPRLQLH